MLVLTISHIIHLTKKERYKLINKGKIAVTGTSVPVWSTENYSTEPAREVFCKYLITNDITKSGGVDIVDQGYEINLLNENDNIAEKNIPQVEILRDLQDYGNEFYAFKVNYPLQDNQIKEIKHNICIYDIKKLTDSLII